MRFAMDVRNKSKTHLEGSVPGTWGRDGNEVEVVVDILRSTDDFIQEMGIRR